MFLKPVALAAGLTVVPLMCLAQPYCSEPSHPYCLTSFSTFEDEFSFNRCQSEMESYRREVEEYGSCLGRWVEETAEDASRKQDGAISDYQDAVEYWNCKASDPDGFCPSP